MVGVDGVECESVSGFGEQGYPMFLVHVLQTTGATAAAPPNLRRLVLLPCGLTLHLRGSKRP
jgi:hypothetical protein